MPETVYPKMYLYKRMVQAKLYIDRHYTQNIVIGNIASEACFSRFHFIRLFKKTYGKTPHHYLTNCRIEKAKQLLSKNKPVSDVCLAVGFSSITSFTALFKKATGFTPALWQQQQLQRHITIKQEPLHFVPACFAYQHGWM